MPQQSYASHNNSLMPQKAKGYGQNVFFFFHSHVLPKNKLETGPRILIKIQLFVAYEDTDVCLFGMCKSEYKKIISKISLNYEMFDGFHKKARELKHKYVI